MEFLGLLAGALLALIVALALFRGGDVRRRRPVQTETGEDLRRVGRLCAALSGDPERDRPLLNRILALGPGVVPQLLDELAAIRRSTDGCEPARLAQIEELIADFGLAALGPVTDLLARLNPTAPLVPSLLRIIRRLGQPGLQAFVARALDLRDLAPFVGRLRFATPRSPEPARAVAAALAGRAPTLLRRDLETLAGLVADHPALVDHVWNDADPPTRVTLLGWLADWLPLARPEHIERGLADEDPAVRCAAARLAALLVEPRLLPRLVELAADPAEDCRRAAVHALGAQALDAARPPLLAALSDASPVVAREAAIGLARGLAPPEEEQPVAAALAGTVAAELLAWSQTEDPLPLLAALDAPDPRDRQLAALLLVRRARHDPRARERLIRLAASDVADDRVVGLTALAAIGDAETPELLARALRAPPSPEALLDLQVAAQQVGEGAVLPLARRVKPSPPERIEATLAVLRVQPYAAGVPPLLRGLEDVRSGVVEGLLDATLHAGGETVREAVMDCLRDPTRGLVAPALRFLAAYAAADDARLLLSLFDRHPPLRGVILNLVEGLGGDAAGPLRRRIDEGGDDTVLTLLEERLALLSACEEATGDRERLRG